MGQKIVTISGKKVPPPPRKVIIERLPSIPSKPQSIIIERWLPYREQKRRVIFQKPEQPEVQFSKQKNVIIQWEMPKIEIKKEFKDLGIVRANPVEYVQRFGTSLKHANELPDFVKEIKPPNDLMLACDWEPSLNDLDGDIQALSLIDLDKEGLSDYKNIVKQLGKVSAYYPPVMNINTQKLDKSSILKEIFNANADSLLSIDDARKILYQINEKLGKSYSNQDEDFLRNLDKNQENKINMEEFKQALLTNF